MTYEDFGKVRLKFICELFLDFVPNNQFLSLGLRRLGPRPRRSSSHNMNHGVHCNLY